MTETEPTLLRRHAAGTDSARSVLFTVLGELVLPCGGEAWTSAFIDVFGPDEAIAEWKQLLAGP